ncbi:anti-sigma factor [Cryptosporangium sp. NPDC048952]|uniref:anti-sigma factor n=1 Tax=Cryptosporangium sp. NPDC048952 TaxID=3363961 RepID=UPI00371A76BC
MRHVDPERLTLLALGEGGVDAEESHLAECAVCREELATLRHVVGLGRDVEPDDLSPPPPPARVWDAIAAETTALPDVEKKKRWVPTAVAACALGVVLGIGATLGWQELRTPERAVVASTALTPVGTAGGTGDARLVRTDGRLQLEIDVRNLPLTNGFYEAWMFVPGTTRMQAMGSVRPGEVARFPVPNGLDPAGWRGIDVSAEAFDGDPAHSATSVLRGELRR